MDEYKIRSILKIQLGFDYIETISSGKFSDVILLKSPSGERKAGKIVWGGQMKQPQLDVWPLLNHENVVRLENTILMPDIEACCFVIMPQYMTLENIVQSEGFGRDKFSIFVLKRWLSDTLSGTNYLHQKKISHLNIKACNILISYDDRAKLGGFGFAKSSTAPVSGCGIEYPYYPPELCYSRRRNDVLVDPIGVDLWSLGIMTLQLFTKNRLQVELGNSIELWSSEVYTEIFEEIKDLERNIEVSFPKMKISPPDLRRLKNFIRMFLSLKPGDRPSAELAMKHKFLPSGLFKPKADAVWTKKASKVYIEMIVEEHNTLENVRKRSEGRARPYIYTPFITNPPLKPHDSYQLITLSDSNKDEKLEDVRFMKNEEFSQVDTRKKSNNLLGKSLAVDSEAITSAWDRIVPSVSGVKDIIGQKSPEHIHRKTPGGTPEKKKKSGMFTRARTWLSGKFRTEKSSSTNPKYHNSYYKTTVYVYEK